jgi:hypothetical protein
LFARIHARIRAFRQVAPNTPFQTPAQTTLQAGSHQLTSRSSTVEK